MFHYDLQLQVNMYNFVYVNPDTVSEEEFFHLQFVFAHYKKMSTPVPVPKHWIGFSYIRSEDYALGVKFDET